MQLGLITRYLLSPEQQLWLTSAVALIVGSGVLPPTAGKKKDPVRTPAKAPLLKRVRVGGKKG